MNVGAGSGNYEPTDRGVVGLEPSSNMIGQRRSAHPVIQGFAESLPFRSGAFDATMCTFTIHHWSDRVAGLRELRRVSDRQVMVVYDPAVSLQFWLVDYFPEARVSPMEVDAPTPEEIGRHLDVTDVQTMWIPADCSDGVAAAYWRRPEAYTDPAVQRSISLLALLPDHAVARGTAALVSDLADGTWHARYGHLLEKDEVDYGYRLVVANG